MPELDVFKAEWEPFIHASNRQEELTAERHVGGVPVVNCHGIPGVKMVKIKLGSSLKPGQERIVRHGASGEPDGAENGSASASCSVSVQMVPEEARPGRARVVVDRQDDLTRRGCNTAIPRSAYAGRGLDNDLEGIRELRDQFPTAHQRVIGGPIVDHDHLGQKISDVLSRERFKRPDEVGTAVSGWNDDRDVHGSRYGRSGLITTICR